MNLVAIPQVQALLVAWAYVKKYAWLFFAILAFVLGYLLLRKGSPADLSSTIDAINKQHADEIKAIQDANAKDIAAHEANEQKLQAALALLDQRYRDQLAALDQQKQDEINQIIATSGNDPQALADALAKQLDLQVKTQ